MKTWNSKKDKAKPSIVDSVSSRLRSTFTIKMIIMWTLYLLLLWYVKAASAPLDRFDPFEILQIPESASEADIKRAYRKLSLQYHPDKNPDPAAADYFAEYIAKAYKSLTDEVSRENYKKYGHPDGQQAVSISVALPEWFFNKDKEAAPAILLTLLLGGIVLPLGLAACYLGRSNKYTGPNEVMMETVGFYMHSPYAIKQFQGVGKLLETLVCAMEFVPPQFNITAAEGPALQSLVRNLSPYYPELRDKKSNFFGKRNQAIVKAHLLLLAYMSRVEVDPILKKDFSYVLEKVPRLIQEMFAVASIPGRVRPAYAWLTPTVGTVELIQCIVKAVSAEEKKKQPASNPTKSAESIAAVLQLPHIDEDVVRQLSKRKIKTLGELQGLSKPDRRSALQVAGLSVAEVEEVETGLSAFPSAFVSAKLYLEGPNGEPLKDVEPQALESGVTCSVHVMLLRPAHQAPGFDPDTIKGKAARAYAPNFPYPREEHWFFLLGDQSTGTLLGMTRVSLLEAEAVGARYAANWMNKTTAGATLARGGGGAADGSGNPLLGSRGGALLQLAVAEDEGVDSEEALIEKLGQKVEFKFLAPPAGKHDLTLYVMPDSWIGADRVVQLKLKTTEMTRAEREGRAGPRDGAASASAAGGGAAASKKKKKAAAAANLNRSEESELMLGGEDAGAAESGEDEIEVDQGSGTEDEDDLTEDEEEREYDSDEYGTEESGDEEESEDGGDGPPGLEK